MKAQRSIASAIAITLAAGVAAGTAHAATITPGFYRLHNHPDGSARPPLYGARLDELYDVNPGSPDDFTFDFDYTSPTFNAAMWLTVTDLGAGAYTLSITGRAWGGRDIGTGYADDQYRGIYEFQFDYVVGAQLHPADDDILVIPPLATTGITTNSGTVETPLGDTILLEDKSNGSYSFRFGDEDNEEGHRGFDGISGWGWLMHGLQPPLENHPYSDWLFTAERSNVPTPGSLALAGLAGGLVVTRRRRNR